MAVDFAEQQDYLLSRSFLQQYAIGAAEYYFPPQTAETTEQTQQDPPSAQRNHASKEPGLGISNCDGPVQPSDVQVSEIPTKDNSGFSIFQWKRKMPVTKASKLLPTDPTNIAKKHDNLPTGTDKGEKVTEPNLYSASSTVISDMAVFQMCHLASKVELDGKARKLESGSRTSIHAKDAVHEVSNSPRDISRMSRPLQLQRALRGPLSDLPQSSADGILSEQSQNTSQLLHNSTRTGEPQGSSPTNVYDRSTRSITHPGSSEKHPSKMSKYNGGGSDTALAAARIVARGKAWASTDDVHSNEQNAEQDKTRKM
jgi:hypothetical protein